MKIDLVIAGYIIHKNRVLLIHHKKLDLWLPVGGHIEKDETPDDAILREIKEEVGIDVEILNYINFPIEGNNKKNLSIPFYVNVHSVGDHDHCCFYYLCRAINPEKLKINKELKNFGWFSKEELEQEHIPLDVRNQCLKALELFNKLGNY
jgi:8-oxo-dGTP pyrophosphatase MutT (NUDIX family)